ncbi:YkvA family protein [Rhizobium sp. SL86]|uniref:YkvA family protein n=1 Tax=Rhizobium sp. SL86 TaxID=2995148 RepID=UPI0022757EB5|nr:YkvA family protein [Rhizobium sp. SL86]MCY1665648.1 YkvA family protein [Rhizobium sp. SL86]
MDDVKIGEILLPGDEDTQERQERQVRSKFWPTMKRAVRYIPFSRDLAAAYFCAMDPQTPTRVRGVLLAALGYFVLPLDFLPDIFAVVGFTDDVAVLMAAFRMIQAHIKDSHYQAADEALSNEDVSDDKRDPAAAPAGR